MSVACTSWHSQSGPDSPHTLFTASPPQPVRFGVVPRCLHAPEDKAAIKHGCVTCETDCLDLSSTCDACKRGALKHHVYPNIEFLCSLWKTMSLMKAETDALQCKPAAPQLI